MCGMESCSGASYIGCGCVSAIFLLGFGVFVREGRGCWGQRRGNLEIVIRN